MCRECWRLSSLAQRGSVDPRASTGHPFASRERALGGGEHLGKTAITTCLVARSACGTCGSMSVIVCSSRAPTFPVRAQATQRSVAVRPEIPA
jgi:hypothetical protein